MFRGGLQQRLGGCLAASVLVVAASNLCAPGALAATPELSATATPAEFSYGGELNVTGRIGEEGRGLAGVPLALQANAYPFRGFQTIAQLSSASDGSFRFASVRPDRNTRMRVVAEGAFAASSPTLAITIDASSAVNASSIGAGRVRLSLRLGHATIGGSPPVGARWFLAAAGSRVFELAAVTLTREISPGLTYASAIVDPPSKRFVYSVCLNPLWEAAMGPPASHGACPEHDYTVAHDVG
jgi:hypothetical protein